MMNSFSVRATRTIHRLMWAALACVFLVMCNSLVELLFPMQIANASITDLKDVCNTNYQLPDQSNSTVVYTGAYDRHGPHAPGLFVEPTDTSYIGEGATANAYGQGGYFWSTWATSICAPQDIAISFTTVVAGFALSGIVSSSMMLGYFVQSAYSSTITESLLDNAVISTILRSINNEVTDNWLIGLLMIALLISLAKIRKEGAAKTAFQWVWIGFCSALFAVSTTTPLIANTAGKIYEYASLGASSALMITTGSDTERCPQMPGRTAVQNAASCASTQVTNKFIDPVFNVGIAGAKANTAAPVISADTEGEDGTFRTTNATPGMKVWFNTEGDSATDDAGNMATIELPAKGVVPTERKDGVPTTAEYMRWAQTYTGAEMKAMQDNPGMRCRNSGSPDLKSLGTMAAQSDGSSGELCIQKWAVRTAVLNGLKISDPSSYAAATGRDDIGSRIAPAVISYPTISFAQFTVGVNAALVFYYGLMLALYALVFFIFVIRAMFKGWEVFRDWFMTMMWYGLNIVYLGFLLGMLLAVYGVIQGLNVMSSSGTLGALAIVLNGQILNLLQGIVGIAFFVLWLKTRKGFASGISGGRMDNYAKNPVMQPAKNAASRVLNAGVGGVAGYVTGGAVGAGVGAARGITVAPKDGNLMVAAQRGYGAGIQQTMKEDARANAEHRIMRAGANESQARARLGTYQMQDTTLASEAAAHVTNASNLENQATQSINDAEAKDSQVAILAGDVSHLETQAEQKHHASQVADTSARSHMDRAVALVSPKVAQEKGKVERYDKAVQGGKNLVKSQQGKLDSFLAKNQMTVTHEMDNTTGELKITDLSTGAVERTKDLSQYDANLSPSKVFTDPQVHTEYTAHISKVQGTESKLANLTTTRDTAQAKYQALASAETQKLLKMPASQVQSTYGADVARQVAEFRRENQLAARLNSEAKVFDAQAATKRTEMGDLAGDSKNLRQDAQASARAASRERQSVDKIDVTRSNLREKMTREQDKINVAAFQQARGAKRVELSSKQVWGKALGGGR